MTILLSILGISLLIVLHELGHYGLARLFDMRVLRFSVGFGPPLLSRQVGETRWQLAAIPLGGYVQIAGMGPSESAAPESTQEPRAEPNSAWQPAAEPPNQADADPRSFRSKPLWQRLLVIFAGPATNWLTAAALIAMMAMTVGFEQPRFDEARIGRVLSDSAAAKAGLQRGDLIVGIDGTPVSNWDELVTMIQNNPARSLKTRVERDGQTQTLEVRPTKSSETGKGYLGVTPATDIQRAGPARAVYAGLLGAWSFTERQAGLLWGMVRGSQQGELAGLPGIVRTMSTQAEQSLRRFFQTVAWLSIGLCILNLLPIPALDGSRLVFLAVEGIRRRPVDENVEGLVHAVGFLLLLGLMIVVSVRDLI